MIRTAFATCVQLGLSCIQEVYRLGGRFDLFITLKDDMAAQKSGRIYLDEVASAHGTELLKIRNINDPEVIAALKTHGIDWLFIIGWSQIARQEVLNAPKRGCIGMHPTLLPKGRGRAAIPWAILYDLPETGVTMFRLDEGVDTGDIIAQGVIPMRDGITATELYHLVDEMHVELMRRHWNEIVSGHVTCTPQDSSQATVWSGRKPEDGEIFSSMTMREAGRMVRAVTHPYPGAFLRQGGKTLRIWSAKVDPESGAIRLKDGYLTPIEYEVEENETPESD